MNLITLLTTLLAANYVSCQKDPNFAEGRTVIVHLFEWKWKDIAAECEGFLRERGYGGVQISPPNENVILRDPNRPWWERYQPVSYKLITRSGDETAFRDMVKRCNAAGVRIYVDLVVNHMAARSGPGTGGSTQDPTKKYYPAVPYTADDFHPTCTINNYQDPKNVRECQLEGLPDLNQSRPNVRQRIRDFMNHLIDCGVAGFRVDAAKHMWPEDLRAIFGSLNNLKTGHGFKPGARPFIYQEVVDLGGDSVHSTEYTGFSNVLEFRHSNNIANIFGDDGTNLDRLRRWAKPNSEWDMLKSEDAVVFVDNHDNQRYGNRLTYKNPKKYRLAIAFMLAYNYGITRVMSSYAFTGTSDPPPHNGDEILSPGFNADGSCTNGWICEHRWRTVAGMVGFRNAVQGTEVANWWNNGQTQIAFCRGKRGFAAFTSRGQIDANLNTCLPAGKYCDVVTGRLVTGKCTGRVVEVGADGRAHITVSDQAETAALAIHVNQRL